MNTCLIVIDVQESFRHRPFFTEQDLPAYLQAQNALIAGSVAQGIPVVRVFHSEGPEVAENPFSQASGQVRALEGLASFDAVAPPLNHFTDISTGGRKVATYIADGLRGDDAAGLDIEAQLDFGVRGALEVFPSQNYVEDKPRGFARPLYCLGAPERIHSRNGMEFESTRTMGPAALRDQKIGNALRTIDTWYPRYAEHGRPLPVEPNGASLEAQEFFRDRKTSAFEFARCLNTLDPASPEGMFMIASLIRGGVFSGGKE